MIELLSILFRLAFILMLGFCAVLLVQALIPLAMPLAIAVGVLCAVAIGLQVMRS